jgi:hypothetical protein
MLHDPVVLYEADTIVVDVRELAQIHEIAPPPDLPCDAQNDDRGDLTMQVKLEDNRYHRRAIGGFFSACGMPLPEKQTGSLRHESYEGKICEPWINEHGEEVCCFSPFELRLNAAKNAEARERRERDDDKWFAQRGLNTGPNGRKDKP